VTQNILHSYNQVLFVANKETVQAPSEPETPSNSILFSAGQICVL